MSIVYEVNVSENKVIEREPTAEEVAQELADRERLAKLKADEDAQVAKALAAKAALFEKLGITEEEAKLLLS
jgi:hypothetical protein